MQKTTTTNKKKQDCTTTIPNEPDHQPWRRERELETSDCMRGTPALKNGSRATDINHNRARTPATENIKVTDLSLNQTDLAEKPLAETTGAQ